MSTRGATLLTRARERLAESWAEDQERWAEATWRDHLRAVVETPLLLGVLTRGVVHLLVHQALRKRRLEDPAPLSDDEVRWSLGLTPGVDARKTDLQFMGFASTLLAVMISLGFPVGDVPPLVAAWALANWALLALDPLWLWLGAR